MRTPFLTMLWLNVDPWTSSLITQYHYVSGLYFLKLERSCNTTKCSWYLQFLTFHYFYSLLNQIIPKSCNNSSSQLISEPVRHLRSLLPLHCVLWWARNSSKPCDYVVLTSGNKTTNPNYWNIAASNLLFQVFILLMSLLILLSHNFN